MSNKKYVLEVNGWNSTYELFDDKHELWISTIEQRGDLWLWYEINDENGFNTIEKLAKYLIDRG